MTVSFSYYNLICYFKHQLRVKVRCDRKRLNRITFDKRWVKVASLDVRKGAIFPPLSHGHSNTGSSSDPYTGFSFPFSS